jgi:DNA-binding MarR family transcriptional regulator
LRLSDLAEALQVSPSRLSHAIDRMQESGWVKRVRCASDRRGWLATLTDEGYAVLEEAAPHHVESVRRHLFDQLTPEQVEQLREISEAVLAHLAEGRKPLLTHA